MAIYSIGPPFRYAPEPTNDRTYQPYYDSGTKTVYVQSIGVGPEADNVLESERGYPEGTSIVFYCEGTTRIIGYASRFNPFATVIETLDSPDCAYIPPGDACDLVINQLVKTDETSTGANDGSVTVNASSSHTPIEYSLDGVNYQASNVFTGLSPNNYNVRLRDAKSGCEAEQAFAILPYVEPIQNFTNDLPVVDLGGGNLSKWSAVFNPIYLTYQRKDFNIVSITQLNTNQVKVKLDVLLSEEQFRAALNGNSFVKSTLYEIYSTAISHLVEGGLSVLVFNKKYIGDQNNNGFININLYKSGYRIETEITFGDDAYSLEKIIAAHSPNYKGQTKADISQFLRTQLSAKDNYDYVAASYKDANLGQSYTIRFREIWKESQTQWFSAPYPLYFTFAAMQLGEQYGGNMAQYVPFESVSAPSQKAKFLTDFKNPVVWGGMPFDLSFIYSENVINNELYIEFTPDCGGIVNSYLLNADAGYLLDADNGRFIISKTFIDAAQQDYPIIQALGVNRALVPDSFDCCANNIKANIYYNTNGEKAFITQTLAENPDPFIDAGVQPKQNGIVPPGTRLDFSGSNSFYGTAGANYEFEAYVEMATSSPTPRVRMTIIKDGVTIFDKSAVANVGASIKKFGIFQPGANYQVTVTTDQSSAVITTIDLPDNNPVVQDKVYIMQDLFMKYKCSCETPFVYIKWLNSRGAWDYYKFEYNQTLNAAVTKDTAVVRYVDNWETSDTIEDVISKSSIKQLVVGADNISEDEAKALQWAKKSVKVQMLVNTNPVKWVTVIVQDGETDRFQTRKPNSNNVRFTLFLPSDNLQTQ